MDTSPGIEDVFPDLHPGSAIRGLRYREELTQAQLAGKIGVKRHHISEMEHGKRPIGSVCDNKESMIYLERIELNPKVCNGVPVIKGTRIPVTVILEQLAEGELWEKVLTNYPELIWEDIQAVLLYAKSSLEHIELEEVYA